MEKEIKIDLTESPRYPLTDEEFDILKANGMSDKDIAVLKEAFAVSQTVDMIPDNVDAFLNKVEKYFPDDAGETLKKVLDLPKTDPKFYQQLDNCQR